MKKILVTGGAGYIGSHMVVELIQAGYAPIVADNLMASDGSLIHGIEEITKQKVNFHKGDCWKNLPFLETTTTPKMDRVFAILLM
jgi:UDP-glucose 4-epimerase